MGTNSGSQLIVPGDPLLTLRNCEGYYQCPRDPEGKLLGPVVGYAGEYDDASDGSKKKWVGLTYYNFSKADQYPSVLTDFATRLVTRLCKKGIIPDLIVGAPWAGVKFSQEVARIIGCRHIFAEKKGDDIILGRYEGEIRPGEKVWVGEELVNNRSTTGKIITLIENGGGIASGIFCAINRSYPFAATFWYAPEKDPLPIVGVIEISTQQFKQNDPVVAEAVAAGNVVWKPKYAWNQMKMAMEAYQEA